MERMKQLIARLNEASTAYYKYDKPIMTDMEYDILYDELTELEKSTGVILANSPTQKVQGEILEGLVKVKHSKPMLSAQKTKDVNEIKKFIGNNLCVVSWKEDGLTIVLRYKNGELVQAITRGSGNEGEDVTHTVKTFSNIPIKLKYCADIEVRGEGLISWENFNKINETIEEKYSHPRNLAAGSVRQLNPKTTRERKLSFKAFELVQEMSDYDFHNQGLDKFESFEYLKDCGFDVVEHKLIKAEDVDKIIEEFNPSEYEYPVDGLIFEINDRFLAKELGATSHHESCRMALKWKDNTYETTLTNIEWNTSRTGLVNPIAIFEPVDLEGAVTTKATLHNISYIEDLELGTGDIITVYRANMVIPKVADNLTRSNTFIVPSVCPECGEPTEIRNDNGSKMLYCINPNCKAKLISRLTHFVSKHAMNIDGLSEATLEFLVNKGWVKDFLDLYFLNIYKTEWMQSEGFGKSSVTKLLKAIEESRNVNLENFLYAQGIPNVGKDASKKLSKLVNGDFDKLIELIEDLYDFNNIDGIGEVINNSIYEWCKIFNGYEGDRFLTLVGVMSFVSEVMIQNDFKPLQDKAICITGKLIKYSNRDALVKDIELYGGKEVSGVTSKTDYLLTNDTTSGSGKNKKSAELGVPIITEEKFLEMIIRQ